MRSLYLRILLALVGAVVASLVAFLATFFAMTRPAQVSLIRQFQARRIDDAVSTYQRGGAGALSVVPRQSGSHLDGRHPLPDRSRRSRPRER